MNIAEEIQKLQALRDSGAITEEEFTRAKTLILNRAQADQAQPSIARRIPTSPLALQKLSRSSRDRWIGGVCGGLGEHTEVPSWAWRVAFCAGTFFYGVGLILYVLLWVFMPPEENLPVPSP